MDQARVRLRHAGNDADKSKRFDTIKYMGFLQAPPFDGGACMIKVWKRGRKRLRKFAEIVILVRKRSEKLRRAR